MDNLDALKVAVLIDGEKVQRFALDALNSIDRTDELHVFSCTNTRFSRRPFRHALYYVLNMLAVRNRLTRLVPVSAGRKRISSCRSFASQYDGAWQKLPSDVLESLQTGGYDVILKFGMGLLRVPPDSELNVPILSFHHGDPDRYRGRPAGFWEMIEGSPLLGQIVQVISNRLDGGRVVAFAETKVMPWSYRATLIEAFRHSPLLINTAIRNAIAHRSLDKPCNGRNCRLPTNAQVFRFAVGMATRFVRRLLYGGFVEKAWKVSTSPVQPQQLALLISGEGFPSPRDWTDLPIAKEYLFYADPFFTSRPSGILVEALDRRSGTGRIVFIDGDDHRCVATGEGHMSYPSIALIDGREFVLPETATWSPPLLCRLAGDHLETKHALKLPAPARVTDGTLFEHDGRVYLFGNIRDKGSTALYLWSAEAVHDHFSLHPASPIRISPQGGRMGGALARIDGKLVRFGQDFTRNYGDGLLAFEIAALSASEYQERYVGRVGFSDRQGPHTLNVADGMLLFDWYVERVSALAGLRRLAARASAMANLRHRR